LARDCAVGDRWGQLMVNVDWSTVNVDRAETGLGWAWVRAGPRLGWADLARTRVARWRCPRG
jgi:sugar lactone lactonase YvrE